MPELPEVETIARDLAVSIVGARVTEVWGSGLPLRLARPVDLTAIRAVALGRRIFRVRRLAKYLLIDLQTGDGKGTGQGKGQGGEADAGAADGKRPGILIHLGMSGQLLVEPAAKARPLHTHLALSFAAERGAHDLRELRFRDPRRFGFVAAGAPVDGRPELGALGPDALTGLTAAALADRLEGVRSSIKAFLLDQTRVAGLGNIYACEALHWAAIHPGTAAGRTRRRAEALLAGIRTSLELGIKNRGTTLRDYVDATGVGGNNASALRVYGREGRPCPRCAAAIVRRVDAGRSTFFCPRCQRR